MTDMTIREEILEEARKAVCERGKEYGGPEDSFQRIAALWAAYGATSYTREDVAIMLGLVKIARLASNPAHRDSWVDLAGYAACGAECSTRGVEMYQSSSYSSPNEASLDPAYWAQVDLDVAEEKQKAFPEERELCPCGEDTIIGCAQRPIGCCGN